MSLDNVLVSCCKCRDSRMLLPVVVPTRYPYKLLWFVKEHPLRHCTHRQGRCNESHGGIIVETVSQRERETDDLKETESRETFARETEREREIK